MKYVRFFERINQEGKKLDPVDIIVARTYRNENTVTGEKGFYLRDNLNGLKQILISKGNQFQNIEDLSIIQMVAICLRKDEIGKRKSFGITPTALDNLTTEILERNWDSTQTTILETIKILFDMKIQGPEMLPFRYLFFPVAYYLHKINSPQKRVIRQWFWRTAFGLEDFRRADQVYYYCTEFFEKLEKGQNPEIEPLTISKKKLVESNYYYKNAFSRAVISFFANQKPLDFSDPDAEVLDNVYLRLSQAPNLHHIYPRDFLLKLENLPESLPIDSLMNICFLRAKTNIQISNKDPLDYFNKYEQLHNNRFDEILCSHLIEKSLIQKSSFELDDYPEFLFARAEIFIKRLKQSLPDIEFIVTD
jgi:hypothetical protein